MSQVDHTLPPWPAVAHRPRRRVPVAAVAVLAAMALLALAVVGLWLWDSRRDWEVPRWSDGRFEVLEVRTPEWHARGERWVVAVFPKCPHCRASLRDLALVRARMTQAPRLAALIVDTPDRPPASLLAETPLDAVFWDRRQVWRRRWGHRVYGEILCFDGAGRHQRTRTAAEIAATLPDP